MKQLTPIEILNLPGYGGKNVALMEGSNNGRFVEIRFENDQSSKASILTFSDVLFFKFISEHYADTSQIEGRSEVLFELLDSATIAKEMGALLNRGKRQWPLPVRHFIIWFQDYGLYEVLGSKAALREIRPGEIGDT